MQMRRPALTACGMLLIALAPVRPSPAGMAPFIRGDVNQSGLIDVSDAVGLIFYLFLGERVPPCLDAADADDGGHLDLSDAIFILNYLFQAREPPPLPYPGCGTDPTIDPLDCESFPALAGCRGPAEGCGNVVARAAERGCGRVFVWGDEHVRSEGYWPATESFWRNTLDWLSESHCGGADRTQLTLVGVNPWPALGALLEEGHQVTSLGLISQVDLDSTQVLVALTFLEDGLDGLRLEQWVKEGGAFMTLIPGFGDQHWDECDNSNRMLSPLGLEYDCTHKAPWGPVTSFGAHPLAAGLSPENAPFVNGRWVVDLEGFTSDEVAHVGDDCSPPEVPDCRKGLEFSVESPPGGDVPVEHNCSSRILAGANQLASPKELNVVAVHEAPGAEVVVQVGREAPMVLVLSAYRAVNWVVEAGASAGVEKVILIGYEPQTAAVPPWVDVESYTSETYGHGDDCSGGNTRGLVAFAESVSALPLRSFHGCYSAGYFSFVGE